jgi:hypothetical protein
MLSKKLKNVKLTITNKSGEELISISNIPSGILSICGDTEKPKKTEDMKKYKKEYYDTHPEKIEEWRESNKELIECHDCGKLVQKVGFSNHKKTKFHLDNLKNPPKEEKI